MIQLTDPYLNLFLRVDATNFRDRPLCNPRLCCPPGCARHAGHLAVLSGFSDLDGGCPPIGHGAYLRIEQGPCGAGTVAGECELLCDTSGMPPGHASSSL